MADTNLLVLAREFKKLREEVKKVLQIPKGDKGDQGLKGDKGDKGDAGPQGFPGRDGKDGINGYDGKDGRNGVDGKDGKDGLDGVGVANAYIDFDNSLVIVLTNGTEVNAGYLSQETKDAVIANFKQGAQTITELLPSQEGNAGKYLTTDGTSISWATVSGGGSMVYPGAGIAVSTGTAWGTSLTAPSGTIVGTTDTQTLTNKRINARVSSSSSISSPLSWNSNSFDLYAATAQAGNLTLNADSGTPTDGQRITFRFKDNGTPRTLTWTTGASKAFRAIGVTLPTTTTANKTIYVGAVYNAFDDRWDVVAVSTEA